ncbi:hypothetical protein MVEN_00910600 [Mycena venus]|uniref:DUF5648 domain-containing protein n=1 Tax=Mycena venus TaxID=2733690 RepID=A0A8H7CZ09_9AGAR|nr:hypothetical protein MVEN_00910600 [Mycena venus]
MKYVVSALFVSWAFGLASAFNIQEPGANVKRSNDTCGNPTSGVPFYRLYNAAGIDHFYTTDVTELIGACNVNPLQEVATVVFLLQEESTVPFYRLRNVAKSDNFYTISTTERDNAIQNDYVLFAPNPVTYIYPTQICGSIPFYRLINVAKVDNFYTTSEAERLRFITDEG